ncbi:MAG: hypothetical protein ACE5F1_10250 [Planctomycetota bacterium]
MTELRSAKPRGEPGERSSSPLPGLSIALLAPLATWGLLLLLVPGFARPGGRYTEEALRGGGETGILVAALLGVLIGLWTHRSCERGGTEFLKPLALGFLVKILVLCAGTFLLHGPLESLGSHESFAISFVVTAIGFQVLFLQVTTRRRRQPLAGG